MIKIYHHPTCSKSAEGLEILENSGKTFEIVDYLDEKLSKEELELILEKLKIRPIDLVRKKEEIWIEELADINLSDDEIIAAIIKYPHLLERPIVLNGNKAIIGRPPVLIKDIL